MTMRFERNDAPSPSTGHPAPGQELCPLCSAPLISHGPLCRMPPVYWTENQAALLIDGRAGWKHEIPAVLLRVAGSSYRTRGASRSRTWSATGLSVTASRRLKRERSGSTYRVDRSTAGTATGKTSDSSKSLSVVADITGTAPAANDCEYGWMGRHYWDRKPFAKPGYMCLICAREKP